MIYNKTPWFALHAPEIGGKFEEFYRICGEGGVLDKRTKELLMLAISSIYRCSDCIEEHLKNALDAGATKEEITETLLIVAVEAGSSQLAWAKELYCKYIDGNNKK